MKHLLIKPKKSTKSKTGEIQGSESWIFKTWR
jgi:hypothetical protein